MKSKKQIKLDDMTGSIKAEEFIPILDEILQKAAEDHSEVSLALLDIDNFLMINEKYGHDFGDKVLIWLSEYLMKSVNEKCYVFRYSGDEFAIVMKATEKEDAFLLMEKIRSNCDFADLNAELKGTSPTISVGVSSSESNNIPTISIGVSCFPADGERIADLVRKAEGALYKAKVSGRNKVCLSREEKMVTKTTHYTYEQLQRLSALAKKEQLGEAALLREALDDLLKKYDD